MFNLLPTYSDPRLKFFFFYKYLRISAALSPSSNEMFSLACINLRRCRFLGVYRVESGGVIYSTPPCQENITLRLTTLVLQVLL
jgi:hypothetical protein